MMKLTGGALRRRLLRVLLEHLRILGVGRQVQQPCVYSHKTNKYTNTPCYIVAVCMYIYYIYYIYN